MSTKHEHKAQGNDKKTGLRSGGSISLERTRNRVGRWEIENRTYVYITHVRAKKITHSACGGGISLRYPKNVLFFSVKRRRVGERLCQISHDDLLLLLAALLPDGHAQLGLFLYVAVDGGDKLDSAAALQLVSLVGERKLSHDATLNLVFYRPKKI
jgi:hypothetical protein